MANERALGLSFIYAAQTWRQLVICYGEDEARALFGLTNVIAVFGGSKDGLFNRELSDLIGTSRVSRTTYNRGHGFSGSGGTSHAGADEPILRPGGDPAATGAARPGHPRERQTTHRPADPMRRRQIRPPAPRRAGRRQGPRHRRPRPPAADVRPDHRRRHRRPPARPAPRPTGRAAHRLERRAGRPAGREPVMVRVLDVVPGATAADSEGVLQAAGPPEPAMTRRSAASGRWSCWNGRGTRTGAGPRRAGSCGTGSTTSPPGSTTSTGGASSGSSRPAGPQHPHIAHELPVLADQRYTAGQAFHSGALEEWHRYTLPLFLERMTARLGNRCVTRHEEWPAAPRYRAFTSPQAISDRSARFDADTATAATPPRRRRPGHRRRHPPSQRPRPPPNGDQLRDRWEGSGECAGSDECGVELLAEPSTRSAGGSAGAPRRRTVPAPRRPAVRVVRSFTTRQGRRAAWTPRRGRLVRRPHTRGRRPRPRGAVPQLRHAAVPAAHRLRPHHLQELPPVRSPQPPRRCRARRHRWTRRRERSERRERRAARARWRDEWAASTPWPASSRRGRAEGAAGGLPSAAHRPSPGLGGWAFVEGVAGHRRKVSPLLVQQHGRDRSTESGCDPGRRIPDLAVPGPAGPQGRAGHPDPGPRHPPGRRRSRRAGRSHRRGRRPHRAAAGGGADRARLRRLPD